MGRVSRWVGGSNIPLNVSPLDPMNQRRHVVRIWNEIMNK